MVDKMNNKDNYIMMWFHTSQIDYKSVVELENSNLFYRF